MAVENALSVQAPAVVMHGPEACLVALHQKLLSAIWFQEDQAATAGVNIRPASLGNRLHAEEAGGFWSGEKRDGISPQSRGGQQQKWDKEFHGRFALRKDVVLGFAPYCAGGACAAFRSAMILVASSRSLAASSRSTSAAATFCSAWALRVAASAVAC